jgi:hypothetical protein
MTRLRDSIVECGGLSEFCERISEKAKQVTSDSNPFREKLLTFDVDFTNTMDAGEERPEISQLMLALAWDEFTILREDKQALDALDCVRERVVYENDAESDLDKREIKLAFHCTKYEIKKNFASVSGKIIGMYNLCHYFANAAQNKLKYPKELFEAEIEYLKSMDAIHLPNKSSGFDSMRCVENVGGIETWTLLRDILFELYLPDES